MMRVRLAALAAAAAPSLAACVSAGAVADRPSRAASAHGARMEAGCIADGGFQYGYNIPVCRTINDPSLWPR